MVKILEWNYKSNTKSSSGYENVLEELKTYTKDKFINSTEKEKEEMILKIFKIYRDKNIFPITYYNEEGIYEEIQKCINKDIKWEGNILNFRYNQGSSLCRFLFPNLIKVESGNDKRTMYNKFYDDDKLYNAISFCLNHKTIKTPVVPTAIKDGLEMSGGGVATNFKPMNAKALYERYCPKNGIIYDFSCGFGGRMLGALTSNNNYTYFGVEPCLETYTHLNELGLYIEHVTNRNNSYKIYCMGSEDFNQYKECADFAFSSPPYFNLEKYSNEPTQCYNKYNNLDDWFNGYVEPTIHNIYKILKKDCYYAVNIADFKIGKEEVKYVDRWIDISKECGFKYIEQIYMKLQTRRGDGHKKDGKDISKKEGIFVFQK